MRDARDPLGFEHTQNLVEVLVNAATLVERRARGIADNALDRDAGKLPHDVAHLAIDPILLVFEQTFGGTPSHVTPGAVVHGEAGLRCGWPCKEDRRAVEHRSRDQTGVPRRFPDRTGEIRVTGREGARCTFAVNEATL